MSKYLYLIAWVILLTGTSPTSAQDPTIPKVTIQMSNGDFADFVKEVERQTGLRFYYDPNHFKNLDVTLKVNEQPLAGVLATLFEGTKYRFALDNHQRVFITEDKAIITKLPNGYFNDDSESQESISYAVPEDERISNLISTAESKTYQIGARSFRQSGTKATLTGYVRDAVNGEPIIGANVFIENPHASVITDAFGFFNISLPKGAHQLNFSSAGMRPTFRKIALNANGKLDVMMQESVISLREIKVEANAGKNVKSTQMGQVRLGYKELKQLPSALGEADLLRALMTMPGVKSVGESSVGLNVRGGSADQNLILYNQAPIYNPSHLFGFFSAFNPEVLGDAELFKSSIPAKYGGRISSVLNIANRDGNKKKWVGSGGIGLLTSRLTIEGPLVKDKSSILISGRATYSDWLLDRVKDSRFYDGSARFYDANLYWSHEIDEKNSLFLSGYWSHDRFRLLGDTTYQYQNKLASAGWKHTFNARLLGSVTASLSEYDYSMLSQRVPENAFEMSFGLRQLGVKIDLEYALSPRHKLLFGAGSMHYRLRRGSFVPASTESLVTTDILEPEQALESSVYIEDQYEVSPELSLSAGVRYAMYNYLGPKAISQYQSGPPYDEDFITGQTRYAKGKVISTYAAPELRISVRYLLPWWDMSLKAGYNTLQQFIHLLSNTMTISPTDTWKLSDPYLKPQRGDQISLGLYKNVNGHQVEISAEGYFKNIRNFLDFGPGDSIVMNPNIETAVINTTGKAYGLELMAKKSAGKINGWVSYTHARTLLRATNVNGAEVPNDGDFYPSNYDKPHDFTLAGNYRFSHRLNASLNFTYSTGRPYTAPIGKYQIDGIWRLFYSERNQFRVPDYYRLDFSINLEGNHKIKKLAHNSWTFGVYNLLGRRNVSSVFFRTENGSIKGYQLSIFARPIPTITYNFQF